MRSGAPTQRQEARQRGTSPATTTAQGQVPSHNGHRGPRTGEACTTHDEPRHGTRCQGQPGPYARTSHPWPAGSGPRPHARKDGWSGVGERLTPDAPHPGKRRPPPPRAPSCRPHSAQSQLARVRAVGFVTGPHARTPRTHSQWVVGPGRRPERTSGRGWESARPWTPHTEAKGAAPGHPRAAPTARNSARCGVGDGSPRPHPPHPQPVGSGPRPHARTDERSGSGRAPDPGRPTPRQEVQ